MKAIWKNHVIAQSDDTIVVEGNHYFPPAALDHDVLKTSTTTSVCGWKGTASYYTVEVSGEQNQDAAWYYPKPKDRAANIKGYVAFWKGVTVTD
ncbi:MAG: DUF427 domain-containing protein [Gammaproteobacteria bacterium]